MTPPSHEQRPGWLMIAAWSGTMIVAAVIGMALGPTAAVFVAIVIWGAWLLTKWMRR